MKKAMFVINPHAGKGKIKGNLVDLVDTLFAAGYEVTVYTTQYRGHAIELVKNRDKDYELVVCSGGDGSLDEVVTGMIQSGFNTDIGYIPAGSTNDFANSLEIPSNMLSAAQLITNNNNFACDVGQFSNDVFVYIAAFGLFTEVSYGTSQEWKNVLGHTAYILEGMKQLQNIKSYRMKVKCHKYTTGDPVGEDISIEDDFIFGMVTNSYSVGGFRHITNNITGRSVALDDGLFEVTLVKTPRNPIELNMILAALMSEEFNTDYMYCFKAKDIIFESEKEVAWTLDGEYGGSHTKVELKNLQKAINIRC